MPQALQTEPRAKKRGRVPEPLDQRILRKSDRAGDCWLWTGRLDRDGYGRITVAQRPRYAHRVAYETLVGPIPVDFEIDHKCRIRHCVKPDHLEPVTHTVNVLRQIEATGMLFGRHVGTGDPASGDRDKCANGHLWTPENTYRMGDRFACKPCRRIRNRKGGSDSSGERLLVDHAAAAARLKAQPGDWGLVAAYASYGTAAHVASYMRTGKRLRAYQPAGAFEGRREAADGEHRVYARYVGGGSR